MIKRRCFHCISGRCIWYLRLGWGICSSLWCLSSPQALLVNTALLLSALKRILAFVPNNLSSSGRRNDSLRCPVGTPTCYAECTAFTWHTVTVPVYGGWGSFQETPFPGGYVSESHQPGVRPVETDAPAAIHTHTHAHTQVAAVSTWDLLQSLLHLHRRFTVQAVMFRGLYLPRQMFTVLAELQQTIIFTPGPWGMLKACWFSCLLPMLMLFSIGNLSIVQFRLIYTCKGQYIQYIPSLRPLVVFPYQDLKDVI